mgnify:CR=1 FL=1
MEGSPRGKIHGSIKKAGYEPKVRSSIGQLVIISLLFSVKAISNIPPHYELKVAFQSSGGTLI